jgi:hypothetical protein
VKQGLREWQRRLERVENPTGLSVAVCGGTKLQRAELAMALRENLRPAFRRTMICPEESAGDGLWGITLIWWAKVQSTLVIRKKEAVKTEWLVQDEIGFVLADAGCRDVRVERSGGNRLVVLDERWPLEQKVERAIRFTLEYMAERVKVRLRLQSRSPMTLDKKVEARRAAPRGSRSAE